MYVERDWKWIREATKIDLSDILEIYNDAILNTTAVYDYQEHTLEDRVFGMKINDRQDIHYLFLKGMQKVVAYATFGPFRAWPAYKYTIEHSVYVHQDYCGAGIATQMMQEIIKIATGREYATLVAGIDAANEVV